MYPARQRLTPGSPSLSAHEEAGSGPVAGASKHRNSASLSPYERTLQRMRDGAARSASMSAAAATAVQVPSGCGVCLVARGAAAAALSCGHCGRRACAAHSWACGACMGVFCSLCGAAATAASGEESVRCPSCQALTRVCDCALPSEQPAVAPSARRNGGGRGGGSGSGGGCAPAEAMQLDVPQRAITSYFRRM